jgi:regulator of RNase E activity RraA
LKKENHKKNFDLNRREFLAAASAGLLAVNSAFPTNAQNKAMSNQKNEIDFLEKYPTSLIESAISLITGTHSGIVFTRSGELARRTSNAKRLVGYAVTCEFSTDADDERGRRENADYWNYVFKQSAPKIAVAVDVSRQPGSGSSWGQLNGHIHRALGCRGVLTNGGVRDINIFDEINFTVYAGSLTIGHGNPHFVRFGETVDLYGAKIGSGDCIAADEHGAIVVPKEHLPHIEEAAAEINRRVKSVADYCRAPDFSPAGLIEATKKMKPAAAWKPSKF